ncbi:hypothetical protein SEVIR_4G035802v4 [Setaria viridis]|uniref:Uncharacterized protein n=1 Tax=Setaria viridis TaxID=4556 RepID=A0A4U6UWK3_SETVI|nr:hypothetical protein SEVIR_4G035802v2 [Setaria viridis]
MASPTTLTILLGFAAVFVCIEPLETAAKIQFQTSASAFARAAASALLPAVLATIGLTLLLLVAHVRALSRANPAAAGAAELDRLAKATLAAATTAALLGGAVMGFVAD